MNGLCLIFFFGGFIIVSSKPYEKPVYDLDKANIYFEEFIKKFDKQYASEEEKSYRLNIFKKNLQDINMHNEKNPHAVFDINKLSDLEHDEYKKLYPGLGVVIGDSICEEVTGVDTPLVQAPEDFDWRDKNVVTPVKDQTGYCGSCWTFSTAGNIESMNAIKTGQLINLSEQQLLDCSLKNGGCSGGQMRVAFSYVLDSGGIMSDDDYPYEMEQKQCRFEKNKVAVKLSGCRQFNLSDEEQLRDLLVSNGPLSVALNYSFTHYKHGILENSSCTTSINHAVLLVGYGVENGVPFWIIKNSFGESWGEDGYFRMKRGVNMCGIMNDSISTAIV